MDGLPAHSPVMPQTVVELLGGPGRRCGPPWIIIKLLTDSGIVGWGEAYWLPFASGTCKVMIKDMVGTVIGEEPRRRKEYLRVVDAVFMEKTLDTLSDKLGVKL